MTVNEYPECEKLLSAQPEYGAIINFLEWMGGQGIHRMHWVERTSTRTCNGNPMMTRECESGRRVVHVGDETRDMGPCKVCNGTGTLTSTHEDWEFYPGSTEDLVRQYFRIDPVKLEQERRAMLNSLGEQGS